MNVSERTLKRLHEARSIVAFTGAGISAESGVPTFRGNQGLWKKFRPEELANLEAFMRNPALVWEWYAARRKIIEEIRPNPGHLALAELERLVPSLTIVTQNIDNLHRRAGNSTVFELHGNIERNYCLGCGKSHTEEEIRFRSGIPTCHECGGLVRPDVVWFGELLPMDQWEQSLKAIESADVVLSIGTSGVVYPAAELPGKGKLRGAYLVEVNPEGTEMTDLMDESVRANSATVLPEMVESLRAGMKDR